MTDTPKSWPTPRCLVCGEDMAGIPITCPACGWNPRAPAPSEAHLERAERVLDRGNRAAGRPGMTEAVAAEFAAVEAETLEAALEWYAQGGTGKTRARIALAPEEGTDD